MPRFTVRQTGQPELDRVQRAIAAAIDALAAQLASLISGATRSSGGVLTPSGVTPGTYTFATVQVDVFGRVTYAANGSVASDLAYYLVSRASSAPVNAVNLGLLASGVLQQTVASSISTPSVLTVGTGQVPFGDGTGKLAVTVGASTGMVWDNGTGQQLTIYKSVASTLATQLILNNPNVTPGGSRLRFSNSAAVLFEVQAFPTRTAFSIGSSNDFEVSNATKTFMLGHGATGDILVGAGGGATDITPAATGGFAWIPRTAGAFTGTPTYYAGGIHSSPIGIDDGNGRFYAYYGGAWHWTELNNGAGGGANALGYYLVTQATNAPANAIDLGSMTQGVLQQTVTASVATVTPFNMTAGRVPFGNTTGGIRTDAGFDYDLANSELNVTKVNTNRVSGIGSGLYLNADPGNALIMSLGGTTKGGILSSGFPFFTQLVGPGLVTADASGILGVDTSTYITGALTTTDVLYASGPSTVAQDSRFNYNDGTAVLTVPTIHGNTLEATTGDLSLTASAGGAQVHITATTLVQLVGTSYQFSGLTTNGFLTTTGGIGTVTVGFSPTASRVPFGGATAGTLTDTSALTFSIGTGILLAPIVNTNTVSGFGGGGVLSLYNNVSDDTHINLNGSGVISVKGDIVPSATGTYDLGSSSLIYTEIWGTTHYAGSVSGFGGGGVLTLVNNPSDDSHIDLDGSGFVTVKGNIVPSAANTYDIGSSTKPWKRIVGISTFAQFGANAGESIIWSGDASNSGISALTAEDTSGNRCQLAADARNAKVWANLGAAGANFLVGVNAGAGSAVYGAAGVFILEQAGTAPTSAPATDHVVIWVDGATGSLKCRTNTNTYTLAV